MSKGVLLIATNNEQVDYIKQSLLCAKQIKKHLKLDVCLATDNSKYLKEQYPFYEKYIDEIVELDYYHTVQRKFFFDGSYSQKTLLWKNHYRVQCYDITPYKETIVMDVDYIVTNSDLLNCFNLDEDFLIHKTYKDINPNRYETSFNKVSDRSIHMFWATVFYFKKTKLTKLYFDLVNHIHDNWNYYRLIYQIPTVNFRNDYAFSIAIHILNGFQDSNWPKQLPGKFWITTDIDVLLDFKDDTFKFLLDSTNNQGSYSVASIRNSNVHVMNKFSLNRIADEIFKDE